MSSTRKYLPPYKIVTDGDMSANITSTVTEIKYLDQISIQITSVNTNAIGQFSIEGSLDNLTFVPITLSPTIAATTSGNNDAIIVDMKLLSFPYIRVKYTRTSGAGICQVYISGKGN